MSTNPASSPPTDPNSQSGQPASFRLGLVTLICTLITAVGAGYAAYLGHKTQSDVETLKTNSEQQVATIKANTEIAIKQAELRSQENLVRLKNLLEADKDQRTLIATSESAARSAQATTCDEVKTIRNVMSNNIPHLKYNDPGIDESLLSLETASNKLFSYLTQAGFKAINESMPKTVTPDLQGKRNYYNAVLEAYNAEIRLRCP